MGTGIFTAPAIDSVATGFPQTRFAIIDCAHHDRAHRPKNVLDLSFSEEQAGYLAGHLAALQPWNDSDSQAGGITTPATTRIVDPPPSPCAAADRPLQDSPDIDFEARVLSRAVVRPADSKSRSVASALSIRRMRVSGFFALSIARTCSRLRPSGRRS
jgi:ABC transporter substrate-binding protein PnrA-like